MIVTVTPNPSLDRTFEVDRLDRGAVLRSVAVRTDPGGKGINVARALVANGHPARAVLPLGGHDGEQLRDDVAGLGIDLVAVALAAPTRTNVSVVEPDGTVTKINAPGPRVQAAEVAALRDAVAGAVTHASWVAGCGSLPPGAPDDFYAELVRVAHAAGALAAVDASGTPLEAALAADPDLVKPNAEELAAIVGAPVHTLGDVVDGAQALRRRGARTVVVSLGADGAVLVDGEGAWHATTPRIVVRSAVGAGDSLVAGLLAADGRGPETLRTGVAYGSAAARLPGTQLPGPADLDLDAVEIHDLDLDRPLTEPGGIR